MLEPGTLLIIFGGAAAAGLFRVGVALRDAARRREIERRLDGGLGTFTDGEHTTIVGKVRATPHQLEAPFSGCACVAYRAIATTRKRRYEARVPDLERSAVVPFELATDRGIVLVDATDAVIQLTAVPVIPRQVDREAAFVQACGFGAAMRDVTCEEVFVDAGRRIAVHGVLSLDVARPSGYRDTTVGARLRPHPEHGLTIGEPR